ncbi:signal peptidase II [Arcobacter sp. KX21116]|jgi:signal peptidase II|uniref:signal peptidase II n=1 Tax=Arcobacter iocasae TaxID=2906515 RepID=UPI0035D47D7D|tara:strand:+ start:1301 stop:1762 length:462 start_codon:yes stop_codon:yes gene_type:complete
MNKKLIVSLVIFVLLVLIDQAIKYGFVFLNFGFESDCISLVLAYNYGVAFSMFEFLSEYLKFIQLTLIACIVIYLYLNKEVFLKYYIPISILLAGGLSNILDRFTYGAVVDYVYWHCGFDFAIFNFADVIIDFAIAIILYMQYKQYKEDKKRA